MKLTKRYAPVAALALIPFLLLYMADKTASAHSGPGLLHINTVPDGNPQGPDVITNVDGKPVHTVEQMNAALAATNSGEVVSIQTYNRSVGATRVERLRVR